MEALLALCSLTSPFVLATAATGTPALPSSPSGRVSLRGAGGVRLSIASLATLLPFAKALPLPALPAPGATALGPAPHSAGPAAAPAAALDASLLVVSTFLAAQALRRKASALPQPLPALAGLLLPLLRLAVWLLASAPHSAAGSLQLQAAQPFLDTCLATFSSTTFTEPSLFSRGTDALTSESSD